ncbi:hypothetical protein [Dactylosporangium sp. NPDC050588]
MTAPARTATTATRWRSAPAAADLGVAAHTQPLLAAAAPLITTARSAT